MTQLFKDNMHNFVANVSSAASKKEQGTEIDAQACWEAC